jgi:hypothetical protein
MRMNGVLELGVAGASRFSALRRSFLRCTRSGRSRLGSEINFYLGQPVFDSRDWGYAGQSRLGPSRDGPRSIQSGRSLGELFRCHGSRIAECDGDEPGMPPLAAIAIHAAAPQAMIRLR